MKFEIKEFEKARGSVRINIFESGKLVKVINRPNLILNGGRALLAQLLVGDDTPGLTPVAQFAYGDGVTAPVGGNTYLEGPTIALKNVDSATSVAQSAIFEWSIEAGEGNGTDINELALVFHNGFENAAFSRIVLEDPIHKNAGVALSGTWTISF